MKKDPKDNLPAKGSESPFQLFEQLAKKVVTSPKKAQEQKPKKVI